MKKIYVSLLLIAAAFNTRAQLSLTKALNEPVIGDVYNKQQYDSTTAVPKNTGAGQTWNFATMTANSFVETSTYTTTAATGSASTFPNATIAEMVSGSGQATMYKATSTTFEFQGILFPGAAVNFSNTGIFATWPINYGSNTIDSFGGSTPTGTVTNSLDGFIGVNASGNGTVIMPGGLSLSNCLQVVVSLTVNQVAGAFTQTLVSKEYTYYHSSSKFPVISYQYQATTQGTTTTNSFQAFVNTAVVAGIKQQELSTNLSLFPNPAKDLVNITLDNPAAENISFTIVNTLGQTVKTNSLGNDKIINSSINVTDQTKGLYMLNIMQGSKTISKKIIIE